MDVAGDNQLNLDDEWTKRRLDLKGNVMMDTQGVKEIANDSQDENHAGEKIAPLPDDYCGDCYGAGEEEGDCCNTCASVIQAYTLKGWSTKAIGTTSSQCKREGLFTASSLDHLTVQGEGCNLSGSMRVNKVAGNFHVAMGEAVVKDGRHIHQFLPSDAPNFNTTHIIHEMVRSPARRLRECERASEYWC